MSDLVIKVKYGDTLRRFSLVVKEDGSVDLNMALLSSKILSLFKLAPDADIIITYIDEDKDVVTLVDDDDLHDALKQNLNPLRINVLLNSTRAGRYETRSGGTSTPIRSPRIQVPSFSYINSGVTEVLKSVPEPFRDALSKLSTDLAAKAASSGPVLNELVEVLSKVGLNSIGSVSSCNDGMFPSTLGGAADNPIAFKATEGPESSKESAPVQNPNIANTTSADEKKVCEGSNVNRDVGLLAPNAASTVVDLNLDPIDSFPPMFPTPYSGIDTHCTTSVIGGDNKKQLPANLEYPCSSQVVLKPQSKCPFSWQTFGYPADAVPPGGYKRSYNHADSLGRIFHKGVRCDGCGVHPITGPRFKSKVKENYDLCGICYSEMGNEAEYIRIDRPIPYRSPRFLKEFFDAHYQLPTPPFPQGGGAKPFRPKLDCRFIQDVNVVDGTVMPPGFPFKKIWRMSNCGATLWPHGTQFVWIGGDQFSDKSSVELEIPVGGFPVDREIDVAVDFRAPQLPGRYVSYWRMASPSGQKFGQRVWVLIQVYGSQEHSVASDLQGLNLNLPPESNGSKVTGIIDVNIEPLDSSQQESGSSKMGKESVKPPLHERPSKDQALKFPVNDSLLVGSGASIPVVPVAPTSVSYPIIDFSEGPSEPSPVMNLVTSAEETNSDVLEQTLLKELEEMGFKQSKLNKEILRKNEYNLWRSVDDLCDAAEWDPILTDLQEMGFCDRETNKKLLIKNGGSIKQVVLDLINGDRA